MIDTIITDIVRTEAPSDDVAVLMSGGIDSMTCAFSAQRLGKTVHTYTMKVNGVDNPDNLTARLAADIYGWDHHEIDVPVNNLKDDFMRLMRYYDCKKKTHVECTFPFLYVYPHIKEAHVLSGVAADGWYGVSKKANMHYKHTKELFDKFRTEYFGAENPAGILQQEQLAEEIEANLVAPYVRESVKEWMMQHDWDFFNKPFQKAPIVKAYPEFEEMPKRRRHANLQLVAGIPEHFETLLKDRELNYKNRQRTMDLVRDYVGVGKNQLFA